MTFNPGPPSPSSEVAAFPLRQDRVHQLQVLQVFRFSMDTTYLDACEARLPRPHASRCGDPPVLIGSAAAIPPQSTPNLAQSTEGGIRTLVGETPERFRALHRVLPAFSRPGKGIGERSGLGYPPVVSPLRSVCPRNLMLDKSGARHAKHRPEELVAVHLAGSMKRSNRKVAELMMRMGEARCAYGAAISRPLRRLRIWQTACLLLATDCVALCTLGLGSSVAATGATMTICVQQSTRELVVPVRGRCPPRERPSVARRACAISRPDRTKRGRWRARA
jgi:hypothetical protein